MVAMPYALTKLSDGELYAKEHGATWDIYKAAGWRDGILRRDKGGFGRERPALAFTTDSGTRYRFTDGEKPKYDQNPGYKKCWYGLKRAVLAIAKQNNIPFIVDCNGAPSTVPAQAKGVPAFSLQAGEDTSPGDDLINEVKTFWSGLIIVAMDCDAAGRNGAVKRVREWRKAGFESYAVDLALDKDGGDLADFVALHDKPNEVLPTLKQLDIPVIVERPKYQYENRDKLSHSEEMEKAQKALNALSTERRDQREWWYRVGMILKDAFGEHGLFMWDSWSRSSDKYKEKDLHDTWKSFRGKGWGLGSLYTWANEDYGTSWSKSAKRPAAKVDKNLNVTVEDVAAEEAPSSWQWDQGLPFGVRSALNQYAYPAIAPVLELWVEAINEGICYPDEPVDIEFLRCASELLNRDVTINTIRNGIKQGCGQFLLITSHIYIYNTTESYTGSNIRSDEIKRNTSDCQTSLRAGRPSEKYQLLPHKDIVANLAKLAIAPILEKAFPITDGIIAPIRAEFLQELGCEPEQAKQIQADLISKYGAAIEAQPNYQTALRQARAEYERFVGNLTNAVSSPIPKDLTYKNSTDYMAACARAFINFHIDENGETQIPRKTLCLMIGCTDRNLTSVLNRGGVYVLKRQYSEQPIKSVKQLQAIPKQWNQSMGGFPESVVSSRKEKPFSFSNPKNPKLAAWVEAELKAGATLSLRYHRANKQTIHPPEKPIEIPAEQPEPEQASLRLPPTIHMRYMIAIAQAILLDWLTMVCFLQQELKAIEDADCGTERPEPTYAEQWVEKFTVKVTPFKPLTNAFGDRLHDPSTGELISLEKGAKQMIDILLTHDAPPIVVENDPLVDFLISKGGVVSQVIEHNTESHNGSANRDDLRGIPQTKAADQAKV